MSTPHRFSYDAGQIDPIADPGTGNSFKIKGRSLIRVEMESAAGGETRTLPIPSAAGQIFQMIHAIDGGDIDITITSGFDNAGDTAMNTATAGDYVTFMSVKTAADTYRWRILGFEGFTGISEITDIIDLNGLADGFVLDADADTTISAPTDDQIDFEAGGTDRFRITEQDAYDVDYNPANRIYVFSDFGGVAHRRASLDLFIVEGKSASRVDPYWLRSGSGKGSWQAGTHAPDVSADGAMWLQAGKSATSAYTFIKPILGSRLGTIKWNTNKEPRWRFVIKPKAIVQNTVLVGLYSESKTPNRFDQAQSGSNRIEVFFRSSDSQWRVHVGQGSNGSSSAVLTTSAIAVANTVADIDIRVNSSRIVTVYINGVLRYTGTQALIANKDLIPIIGLQTLDTAKVSLGCYHFMASQAIDA